MWENGGNSSELRQSPSRLAAVPRYWLRRLATVCTPMENNYKCSFDDGAYLIGRDIILLETWPYHKCWLHRLTPYFSLYSVNDSPHHNMLEVEAFDLNEMAYAVVCRMSSFRKYRAFQIEETWQQRRADGPLLRDCCALPR
jgi:hypothetical protein